MTDEAFVLKQTNAERKRNGYGTFHKKRRGGKAVRFPSDYLSRREKMALNGDVVTWNLKKPMTWEQFKKMPHDVQQEYLDILSEKFPGVPNVAISDMLGAPDGRMSVYMCDHDLKITKLGAPIRAKTFLATDDGIAWQKWIETDGGYAIAESVESELMEEDVSEEDVSDDADEEKEVELDGVENLANVIRMLAGSGAKLTIEIVL